MDLKTVGSQQIEERRIRLVFILEKLGKAISQISLILESCNEDEFKQWTSVVGLAYFNVDSRKFAEMLEEKTIEIGKFTERIEEAVIKLRKLRLVEQNSEPLEKFSEEERRVGNGLFILSELGEEAPWFTPYGVGVVKIYGIRRKEGKVEFGIGNETPPILSWVTADRFWNEWPE